MQHEKKATQEKCILGKAKHEKSVIQRKYNMKVAQHEKSIVTEQNLEWGAKREFTIVRKRITGLPLRNRYALVKAIVFFYFCKTIHIALFSFLPGNIHHISMTFNHVGVWVFTFLWAMLWFRVFRGFMLYCAVMQFILEIRFNCHHLTTHLCF